VCEVLGHKFIDVVVEAALDAVDIGKLTVPTTYNLSVPSYRKTKQSVPAAREDWVAVPVPDAGIPKEWVLAAREAIKDSVWSSGADDRV
jgi:hypothetical protein